MYLRASKVRFMNTSVPFGNSHGPLSQFNTPTETGNGRPDLPKYFNDILSKFDVLFTYLVTYRR